MCHYPFAPVRFPPELIFSPALWSFPYLRKLFWSAVLTAVSSFLISQFPCQPHPYYQWLLLHRLPGDPILLFDRPVPSVSCTFFTTGFLTEKLSFPPSCTSLTWMTAFLSPPMLPTRNIMETPRSLLCWFPTVIRFFDSFSITAFQFTTNEPQSYVFGGRNHPLPIPCAGSAMIVSSASSKMHLIDCVRLFFLSKFMGYNVVVNIYVCRLVIVHFDGYNIMVLLQRLNIAPDYAEQIFRI